MGSGSAFECPEGLAETKQEANVMQKLGYSGANTVNSFSSGSPIGVEGVPDQFPAGLRILVVDDDPTCLKILERMLRRCMYEVTTCCRARVALSILRERKGGFDLVISDVYMPDMDGFKLLEHVGLEMDLPVIMMSADGETSVVMKGIKHGACDYLIKPVRIEALKTIWQHVIRKKRNESKELEHSGSVEDSDKHKKGLDDVEYASSANEGTNGNCKHSRKRKDNDEDGEQDNDDSSTLKKPRVVWSVELHQQFVCAVNQLGIDKAVPKRILELMNVQGLTRENVASHLQKYRLYLRRLSGVAQQQSGLNPSFGGPMEANFGSIASLERLDLQAIVASGQLSRQTLAAFQAGLIGSVNGNNGLGMPGVDLAFLLQQELHGTNCNPQDRVRFRQPLLNNQGNLLQSLPTGLELKQLAQSQQHIPSFENAGFSVDDTSSGFPLVQQKVVTASAGLGDVGQMSGISNNATLNSHNNPLMLQMIQQQQERPLHQHQQQILTSTAQQQQPCTQFQGERLEGGQVLNLPSASILGLQVFSNGIGGRANPVSILGDSSTGKGNPIVGASCSGQVNCVPMPAQGLGLPASSVSVGIGRTPTVDYQNHYLPIMGGNNHSLPSIVGASTPLTSIGTGGDLSMAGMGSLGGMSDAVVSQTLRRPDSNSGTFSVFGQSLSQSNKQGWHVPNLALNAETSQTGSSVPNSHCSQAFSATQGLNIPDVQDEGQVRNFGFVGKGLCLPSRLSDAENTRAVKNVQCQSEHSVDSGPRLKSEGASDLVASSKFEGGLLSEQFPQDDLMSLLFKQQQQGVGLAEGEFNIDGYQLDNIHVK